VHLTVHHWGGEPDATPVLLAHPTGFHGVVWEPVATRLVARGYRVWSLDFRGHGTSDRSPDGYSWDGFARDALAVTRHLGLDGDPSLVAAGHSKGATALLLGETEHPGTYARLWCYEPIMFPTTEPLPPNFDNPLTTGARRRRSVWDSPEQAEQAFASKPPLDVLHPGALHAYVAHGLRRTDDGRFVLACDPDDEAQVYAMAPEHGMFARLTDLHAPVLVACGEHSDAIPPRFAEQIAQRLPHATLEVFDGLGHFGPIEDPDRAVASMVAWERATTR
jgi:pimeloyl-ACP methyl ester carboxylesterase